MTTVGPQPSPALKAAHKASGAALLATEARARLHVHAELSRALRAKLPAFRAAADRHGAAVDLACKLEDAATLAVVLARRAARAESRKHFAAELVVAGGDVSLLGETADDALPTDAARAVVAGKSLSAAWLMATLTGLSAGGEDVDPAQVALTALDQLAPRLDTLAATEVADAFGDERSDASDAYAAEATRRWLPVPLKVWDAAHDRKLCVRCAALDGQVRPFGFAFDGGLVPGRVHPRCRCLEKVWLVPLVYVAGAAPLTLEEQEDAAA